MLSRWRWYSHCTSHSYVRSPINFPSPLFYYSCCLYFLKQSIIPNFTFEVLMFDPHIWYIFTHGYGNMSFQGHFKSMKILGKLEHTRIGHISISNTLSWVCWHRYHSSNDSVNRDFSYFSTLHHSNLEIKSRVYFVVINCVVMKKHYFAMVGIYQWVILKMLIPLRRN